MKTLISSRVRRLFKEGSWVIFGQIIAFIGALAQVRILTEYLEPSIYGQLALGLTIATLINQTVMAGVTPGIGRFYAVAAEKDDIQRYLYASRLMMGFATLCVFLIALLLIAILFYFDYKEWIGLALAALAFAVFSAYSGALSSIQNAARQRAIVAAHSGFDAWLKIGLALVCMLWLGNTSTAVATGFALSAMLITASQLIFLKRLIGSWQAKNQSIDSENWLNQIWADSETWVKQIWAYSSPFLAWGLFGWAQQSSARWALGVYSSTADVGFFAVLSQLGYAPLLLLTTLALTFLTPILFARAGDATSGVRNDNVNTFMIRIIIGGVLFAFSATAFTALFHEDIFKLLVSDNYQLNSHYLPYMAFAGGVFSTAQVIATLPMCLNRPKSLLKASIGSSLIGIAASFLGVYFFSIQGAVAAMLIHSISYFVFCCFSARKAQKESLEQLSEVV